MQHGNPNLTLKNRLFIYSIIFKQFFEVFRVLKNAFSLELSGIELLLYQDQQKATIYATEKIYRRKDIEIFSPVTRC